MAKILLLLWIVTLSYISKRNWYTNFNDVVFRAFSEKFVYNKSNIIAQIQCFTSALTWPPFSRSAESTYCWLSFQHFNETFFFNFYVFIVIYNFLQPHIHNNTEMQNIIKCVLPRPVNDASRSRVAITVTLIRYINTTRETRQQMRYKWKYKCGISGKSAAIA